jgi:hypothetical protein
MNRRKSLKKAGIIALSVTAGAKTALSATNAIATDTKPVPTELNPDYNPKGRKKGKK